MVLRRLPGKFCKVCESTSKVINEIRVKFDWVFQKFERVLQKLLKRLMLNLFEYFNIYIHLDVNSDVNSQPFFYVILQAPSAGTTAAAQ